MGKKLNLGHVTLIKNWVVSTFVSAKEAQSFSDAEKAQARANIGVDSIIGALSDLTTTVKTNIVAAINSVVSRIDDIVAGSVTGVKGDAETEYRIGQVNITKGNIGLGNVDNTSDMDKPVSTAQQAALDLKADDADLDALEGRIGIIEGKIPSAASSSNQLADKAYVEDLITTQGATYRGSVQAADDTEQAAQTALAGITTKDNNDFAYVEVANTPAAGFTKVKRYRYNGTAWVFEYALNNSGFTAEQLAALNSGITSTLVGKITANESAIAALDTRMSAAESDIDTLQSDVVALQSAVSALETSVGELQSEVSSLGGRMTTAEANIISIDGRVTTIEGKIGSDVTASNPMKGKEYIDAGDAEATDAEVLAILNA